MSKNARTSRRKRKGQTTQSEPKYEWVTLDQRNARGQPIIPEKMIQSTWMTTFEGRETGALLRILVKTGYKPNPILMVSNKLYRVSKFSLVGWRRSIEIRIDIDPFRAHEETWFEKMNGLKAEIQDPGTPGIKFEVCEAIVKESGFQRKVIEIHNDKGQVKKQDAYEGHLILRETLQSVLRREWINYARKVITVVFTAAISAIITVFVTLWVTKSEVSTNGNGSDIGGEESVEPQNQVESESGNVIGENDRDVAIPLLDDTRSREPESEISDP